MGMWGHFYKVNEKLSSSLDCNGAKTISLVLEDLYEGR